jgi:ubiquinone/menaquinone biosynthesis C-methylase UbiE
VKRTDYSRIACVYDRGPSRIRPDRYEAIEAVLEGFGGAAISLLDVACGIGNYLRTQSEHYRDRSIAWHGIDLSADMLAVARTKLADVNLTEGSSEDLPYADQSYHYVVCSSAFHHFENKPKAVAQMCRGLSVTAAVQCTIERRPVASLLEHAELRDMSQFYVIPDEAYSQGLERLQRECAADPDATYLDTFARMVIFGWKQRRADGEMDEESKQ